MYFGNVKKRYYGIEKDTNKKYIRGLNIIRKDAPKFIKEKLNELVELCIRDKLTLKNIIDFRKEIETIEYSKLGISKSFGKTFNDYKKTIPQHLSGAKWANEILGTNIDHNDNPLLFYIISKCEEELKPKKRHSAICINDENLNLIDLNKDKFTIDYETIFNKQILEQLKEFDLIPNVKKIINEYEEKTSTI